MTPFETVVAAKLIEQGYDVLTSGWPDFCAVKVTNSSVEARFIEVKGQGDKLRRNQQKLHKILQMLGIEVEVIQEDAKQRMQYPPMLSTGLKVVRRHLSGRPPIARHAAISFLETELQNGPKLVREILRQATVLGVKRSTLYRTRDAMMIVQKQIGDSVTWELPINPSEEKTNVATEVIT